MSHFLVLQHVDCEDLGTLGEALREKGISCKYLRLHAGEPVPKSLDNVDGLVILGGPMNVYEEDKYPWLKDEDLLIKLAIAQDLPTIGICLGAQLIAKAAKGLVTKGQKKEIGWYDLYLTEEAKDDPLFCDFPSDFKVFQWHGDTFNIPLGAVKLAGSQLFANQAFRLKRNIYALQFHLEVTKDIILNWAKEYEEEVTGLNQPNFYPRLEQDTNEYIYGLYEKAQRLYLNFFAHIA